MSVGDDWEMEVDLRSEEKEKRTVHWFVKGIQQKYFITNVPPRVEIAVCQTFLLLIYLFFCSCMLRFVQNIRMTALNL